MSSPTQPPPPVHVVLIDDHDVIHAGITDWCRQAQPPIIVSAAYRTAVDFLQHYPQPTGGVDVVVLDLELHSQRLDFEALAEITAAGHRVIVYSHIEHHEVILRCLDLGAATYLAKSEGRQHLIEALHAAGTDNAYVGPLMAAAICSDRSTGRPALSSREIEVLQAWFQTESKDIVAQRLHIEPTTVRTHLQRIRARYAASGRPAPTKAALLARAIQDGIISIADV